MDRPHGEYDNPFDVGMTGLLGFSSGYHAMMACDVLLMIGSDFPYQQFFLEQATIVQIDLRGEQLGRRTKVDLGLVGDARTTLRTLLPRLMPHEDDRHLKAAREHYVEARKAVHRRELAMPATISLEQMAGFGIFMIKAVLSGRGDEIVDLARTSLWR